MSLPLGKKLPTVYILKGPPQQECPPKRNCAVVSEPVRQKSTCSPASVSLSFPQETAILHFTLFHGREAHVRGSARQREAHDTVHLLLVALHDRHEGLERAAVGQGRWQADARERLRYAVRPIRRRQAEAHREASLLHRADCNGLAVLDLESGRSFDGVSHSVAEVQLAANALLERIFAHAANLYGKGARDEGGEADAS